MCHSVPPVQLICGVAFQTPAAEARCSKIVILSKHFSARRYLEVVSRITGGEVGGYLAAATPAGPPPRMAMRFMLPGGWEAILCSTGLGSKMR